MFDDEELDGCVSFFKRRFGCVLTCSHSATLRSGGHDGLTLRWLALPQTTETIKETEQSMIEALTVGLQKVSDQLEMSKPAPQIVLDDH